MARQMARLPALPLPAFTGGRSMRHSSQSRPQQRVVGKGEERKSAQPGRRAWASALLYDNSLRQLQGWVKSQEEKRQRAELEAQQRTDRES